MNHHHPVIPHEERGEPEDAENGAGVGRAAAAAAAAADGPVERENSRAQHYPLTIPTKY